MHLEMDYCFGGMFNVKLTCCQKDCCHTEMKCQFCCVPLPPTLPPLTRISFQVYLSIILDIFCFYFSVIFNLSKLQRSLSVVPLPIQIFFFQNLMKVWLEVVLFCQYAFYTCEVIIIVDYTNKYVSYEPISHIE